MYDENNGIFQKVNENKDKIVDNTPTQQFYNKISVGDRKGPAPIDPDLEFGPPGGNYIDGPNYNISSTPPPTKVQNNANAQYVDIVQSRSSLPANHAIVVQKQVEEFNPVREIFKKMKKNQSNINLDLFLNIPSPELFETLNSSFDDVERILIDYILSEDNMIDLKISLRNSLRKYYGLTELSSDEVKKEIDYYQDKLKKTTTTTIVQTVPVPQEISTEVEDIELDIDLDTVMSKVPDKIEIKPVHNPVKISEQEQLMKHKSLMQEFTKPNFNNPQGQLVNSFSNSSLSEEQKNKLKNFIKK